MLQIIPAVDVLDGKVVRLMHGDYERVTVYGEDPVAQALEWMRQGAELVHVVDLEGARSGHPDESLWLRLAEAGVEIRSSRIRSVSGAGYAVFLEKRQGRRRHLDTL